MTTQALTQLRVALCNHVLAQLRLPLLPSERADSILQNFIEVLPKGADKQSNIFATLKRAEVNFPYTQDEAREKSLKEYDAEAVEKAISWLKAPTNSPAMHFDQWASAIEVAAANVSGSRQEAGVSLAQEFKILSAVVHACKADADELNKGFHLVLGDFPGVQRVIYTITSDGATKGVRGRSFFLQLLAECVARRVLDARELPMTNALYIAGSKFLLLLDGGQDVADTVDTIWREINGNLLDTFEGDLSMVLATTPVSVKAIKDHTLFSDAYAQLLKAESQQKIQPFRGIRPDLFNPFGVGSQYVCAISRREPRDRGEINDAEQANSERANSWVSWEQQAFETLAVDLSQLDQDGVNEYVLNFSTESPVQKRTYSGLLYKLTGMACQLVRAKNTTGEPWLIALNRADFRWDGLRYIAARTPRVTRPDASWWNDRYQEEPTHVGDIRNFELLARQIHQSETTGQLKESGFARYGVLRMDVDSLGSIFRERLTTPTITRRMALSSSLSRFFERFLPRILVDMEESLNRPESLYLIYGGGDDLFIVGEWDVLPRLAEVIHDLLESYTGGQLTISAGIEIVPSRFPFYVVAELAKAALDDRAKESRDGKNAICMFGEVFNWEAVGDWHILRDWKDWMVKRNDQSIIRNVLNIYEQWLKDCKRFGDDKLRFGPFVWRACYQLTRTVSDKADRDALIKLVTEIPRIAGVAARWAELERRTHHDREAQGG